MGGVYALMLMTQLIYSVAFDPPGSMIFKNLLRLLIHSLRLSGYAGRIMVFHDHNEQLFPALSDVEEVPVPQATYPDKPWHRQVWRWKYLAAGPLMEQPWDRAVFIDADCLALLPVDPLFGGEEELTVCRQPGSQITGDCFHGYLTDTEMQSLSGEGINSGVFAVSRAAAKRFFAEWRTIDESPMQRECWCADQASLNRLVLDRGGRVGYFSGDDIMLPVLTDPNWIRHRSARLLHFVGAQPLEKLELSHSLFVSRFVLGSRQWEHELLPFEYE